MHVIFFHPNDEENWWGAGKIKKNEKSLTPRGRTIAHRGGGRGKIGTTGRQLKDALGPKGLH